MGNRKLISKFNEKLDVAKQAFVDGLASV